MYIKCYQTGGEFLRDHIEIFSIMNEFSRNNFLASVFVSSVVIVSLLVLADEFDEGVCKSRSDRMDTRVNLPANRTRSETTMTVAANQMT